MVTDSANNVSGEAKLDVEVVSGPLVAVCDRGSGDQSKSKDLEIDCSDSYDSDKPKSKDKLDASWTCKQSGGECKSAGGSKLALRSKFTLNIKSEDLLAGATYDLTMTVSKDTRTDSQSMSITIIAPTASSCS